VRGILRSFTASALYVKPVPPVSERRENAGYFGEDISGDIFAILSEARHQWKGGVHGAGEDCLGSSQKRRSPAENFLKIWF